MSFDNDLILVFSIILVLPRLYERLCEEKVNDDNDGDEMDSSYTGKRHRSLSARMLLIF